MGETATEPKPKRRWYQYSLGSLFLVTLVFAVSLGWICHKAREQRKTVEAIEELGGWVCYDYQVDASGDYTPDAEPPGPAWFRNLVGLDFLADVVKASFINDPVGDTSLECLAGLTNLEELHLDGTEVSDAGLEHLQGLTKLEELSLMHTEVSDAGLEHLKGLTNLRELWLIATQVTHDGVNGLEQALPKCCIVHEPPLLR